MPLILSSATILPSYPINQLKVLDFESPRNASSNPNCTVVHCSSSQKVFLATKSNLIFCKNKPHYTLRHIARGCMNSGNKRFIDESNVSNDWRDQELEDKESPWEGAVVYQRNPSITHLEYCTTLERLGLGKLSTEVSRSQTSLMGLRVTKDVKDFPQGTPVKISLDVSRKKLRLRLDGIIRTVVTLGCNRCGEPAAECVFSNFSLLLTEEPFKEPELINMGVIFGVAKTASIGKDEASIDLDDRLYFPPEEKSIDISKHIRDLVHLEITINAICDPTCKGLCLKCGANLNNGSCNCSKQKVKEKGYGPLGGLRKQMQQQ